MTSAHSSPRIAKRATSFRTPRVVRIAAGARSRSTFLRTRIVSALRRNSFARAMRFSLTSAHRGMCVTRSHTHASSHQSQVKAGHLRTFARDRAQWRKPTGATSQLGNEKNVLRGTPHVIRPGPRRATQIPARHRPLHRLLHYPLQANIRLRLPQPRRLQSSLALATTRPSNASLESPEPFVTAARSATTTLLPIS